MFARECHLARRQGMSPQNSQQARKIYDKSRESGEESETRPS